jgi:hypothetical protein
MEVCQSPNLGCSAKGKKILYVRKFEGHVQIANWCAPWKISNGADNFVLQAL